MSKRDTGRSEVLAAGIAEPADQVPLPPPDAKVSTIACEYCPVACGYKVYTWPLEKEGGPAADENALGVDFPVQELTGKRGAPNMHNVGQVDGRPHTVLIIPDGDATVVNVGGTHSVRGGAIAQKLYNPQTPTVDRLQVPLLRVRGTLQPISWDAATDIVAEVSKHVIENHGELAGGIKRYSDQFYENVYASTKPGYAKVASPKHPPHHAPAVAATVRGPRRTAAARHAETTCGPTSASLTAQHGGRTAPSVSRNAMPCSRPSRWPSGRRRSRKTTSGGRR